LERSLEEKNDPKTQRELSMTKWLLEMDRWTMQNPKKKVRV
jgi:hypothetical protein